MQKGKIISQQSSHSFSYLNNIVQEFSLKNCPFSAHYRKGTIITSTYKGFMDLHKLFFSYHLKYFRHAFNTD